MVARSNYYIYNIAKPNNGQFSGLGIGNPGTPTDQVSEYLTARPNNAGSDLLNLNPLFYYDYTKAGRTPWEAGGDNTKDIIKFAFECIDNSNPSQAIGLVFRAFLEGQISDSNEIGRAHV